MKKIKLFVMGKQMKWYSTKNFLPGDEYKPVDGYITPEFYVIYHHGDDELMTNLAYWNGKRGGHFEISAVFKRNRKSWKNYANQKP